MHAVRRRVVQTALGGVLFACGGGLPTLVTSDASMTPDGSTDVLDEIIGSIDAGSDAADAIDDRPTTMDVATPPADSSPENPPPQGACAHSLCTTGVYLAEECDPEMCTYLVCDPDFLGDDYCCTQMWDMTCVNEVATACAPYTCN
jgi:hypothetical protein